MKKQTICLNMIVKNESHVIQRCLNSVKQIIDYWIIVDTGSTDSTKDVIRETLKDIPGELIESTWVNFAFNRNEALKASADKSDYIFIIDADEYLSYKENFIMPELVNDSYDVAIVTPNDTPLRPQILRNNGQWEYYGAIHERLKQSENLFSQLFDGFRIISNPEGARSKNPNKLWLDIEMLNNAIKNEPNNLAYVFYLGEYYIRLKEPNIALQYFQKRAERNIELKKTDKISFELWYSLYQIGKLKDELGCPWQEVLQDYLKAFDYYNQNAMPLYMIAKRYQKENKPHLAYIFFRHAADLPRFKNIPFIHDDTYFQIILDCIFCSGLIGLVADALELNNKLLTNENLPQHFKANVANNQMLIQQYLARKNHASVSSPVENPQ